MGNEDVLGLETWSVKVSRRSWEGKRLGREPEMERLVSSLSSECVWVRVSLTPANIGTRDRPVGCRFE